MTIWCDSARVGGGAGMQCLRLISIGLAPSETKDLTAIGRKRATHAGWVRVKTPTGRWADLCPRCETARQRDAEHSPDRHQTDSERNADDG